MPPRPVLVLTGPPAVGKSTTARALAETRERCTVVDVDDVRQLVVSGGAAPWEGKEGLRQQRLGASNACALASGFVEQVAAVEVLWRDVRSTWVDDPADDVVDGAARSPARGDDG